MIFDLDRILLQRARKLDAAARHPRVRRLRLQHGVGRDHLGWLRDQPLIGGDEAGIDRGAGARPALEQAALHQHDVGALAGGFAVALLCHDQPNFPAASRTHASNAARSCQMSSARARGVTSGEPCRSSA